MSEELILTNDMEESLELMPDGSGSGEIMEASVEEAAVPVNRPAKRAAYPIGEDRALRGADRKVFDLSDGTKQAVFYGAPVHAFDENEGRYVDIDCSLREDGDGQHYVCAKNHFAARFSKDAGSAGLFEVEKGAHRLSVTLQGSMRQAVAARGRIAAIPAAAEDAPAEASKLSFEDIVAGADFEYEVSGGGVKENIVVKEKAPAYRYSFLIDCGDLQLRLSEDERSLSFVSAESEAEVFRIPAPFMTDANGERSDGVFYETIQGEDGKISLSVIADSEWINAEGRALPVTIDPQVLVSGSSVFTTYSWFNNYMTSSATHTIGTTGACNGRRMYMRLAMPSLPRNPRIKKAEINLRQYSGALQSKAPKIGLYKVNQELCTGYCTPGYDNNLLDYEVLQAGALNYVFDVTSFLDGISKGEVTYPNLMFKMVDENCQCTDTAYWCGSSSSVGFPTLTVTYESSYGVGTSARTNTHELGRFGTASIDLQLGNLMFESEDFSWGGKRMPVALRHFYNSALSAYQYTANSSIGLNTADFSAMKVGHGWKLNSMQSMIAKNLRHDGGAYDGFVYTDAAGAESYFRQVSDTKHQKCYTLPGGQCCCYYTYEDVGGSGNIYDSYRKELYIGAETYLFDSAGRLIKITDSHGNTNLLTYTSGRLTSVRDGAGRVFALNYSAEGRLSTIVAPDNTAISYEYTNDRLTKISYPDDRKAAVTYGASSPYPPAEVRITNSAETETLYRVTYSYSGGKVAQVTEYGRGGAAQGQSAAYLYNIAGRRTSVTVTEPADGAEAANPVTTVYTFDDDGNIAGKYLYTAETGNDGAGEGGSGINPYAADGASVVSNVNNLLQNHSFDSSVNYWTNAACNCAGFYTYALESKSMALYGSNVLYMASYNNTAQENGVYQTTDSLPAGKYAFSAYVRLPYGNASGAAPVTRPGVYLKVKTAYGAFLAETEHIANYDGDYVRLIAPFELAAPGTVQAGVYIDGAATAHIDGAQLENNAYANAYDMLTNGNFEKNLSGWSYTSGVTSVTDTKFNLSRSLRITGSLNAQSYALQTVKVKTFTDVRETFTLSGWAKGWGIPDRARTGADGARFRLRAIIQYCDYSVEDHVAEFSPATEEWQLASVQFAKEKFQTVMQVTVYAEYSYNVGYAYFDDIQLVRDRVESGLSASDFTKQTDSKGEQEYSETTQENTAFKEAEDAYGNPLTGTTFKDGEFGTIYRAFNYNCAVTCGNDLTAETDALGNVTAYDVDAVTSRNETVTDRCGSKTEYTYDDSGRTTSLTAKDKTDATLATVGYTYDAFDQLTNISRGDGMAYELNYNAFHSLESIGVPGLTPLVQYVYKNGNGRLKDITYANGDTMHATYNSLGRMVAETWKNAAALEIAKYRYVYDGQGNIVRSIDNYSLKEYNYNYENGRISRATESDMVLDGNEIVTTKTLVNTFFYSYDKDGNLTKKRILTADGTENVYTFTHDDNVAVAKLPTGVTSHSKTDHLGRKRFDELQLGTGFLSRQFSYHSGTVTAQHVSKQKLKSTPMTSLISQIAFAGGRTISYNYDEEERITNIHDSVDGETAYTYDARGQLLSETKGGTTVTVTYDNYGNITSKGGAAYTYDTVWKDKLTEYDGQTIEYDAGGNPLSYRGWEFQWEKGRQLKIASNGTNSLFFTYNANGIRTSKTVDEVRHDYILDGAKILRETYGATKLDYLYDNADSVCGLTHNNTPYYFYKNLQGDIIAITNSSGQVVARYTYDAWGVCTGIWDDSGVGIASINPFRYRGYYWDQELGMYCLQSRYYDPVVGRFLNADDSNILKYTQTRILANNMYGYCENNPVTNRDASGYIAFIISLAIGAVFGVLLLYFVDIVMNLINGIQKWYRPSSSIVDYLAAAAGGALGATGIGKWAAVFASTFLSTAAYIANCAVRNVSINVLDLVITVLIGVVTGLIGGSGTNLQRKIGSNTTLKRKLITAVSPKKIAQYTSRIKSNVKGIIIDAIRNMIATIVGALPDPAKRLVYGWCR